MKPPPFAYHAPDNLSEVVALLAQYGSDARCLAGGQSLVPLMSLRMARPEVLIDLSRCAALKTIERGKGTISYGAMVRQREAERSADTMSACPLIAKALAHAGPIAVRTRATVGGTLAHADRSAELPGVAVALDAVIVLTSSDGVREIPAAEFFLGDMATAIEPTEVMTRVRFPATPTHAHTAFLEVGVRREGLAILGLAAHVTLTDGLAVEDVRLAVTGMDSSAVRLTTTESFLVGRTLDAGIIAQAAELVSASVEPTDDPFVQASYRRHVAGALVKRALEGALGERRH